jgi:hypothetical protein
MIDEFDELQIQTGAVMEFRPLCKVLVDVFLFSIDSNQNGAKTLV